jgi:hypothetical protein
MEEVGWKVIDVAEAHRRLASSPLLSYAPVQTMLIEACALNERAGAASAQSYARLIRDALFQDSGAWPFLGADLEPEEARSLAYIQLLGWLVTIHIRRKCIGTPNVALGVVAGRAQQKGVPMLGSGQVAELVGTIAQIGAIRKEIASLDAKGDAKRIKALERQVQDLEDDLRVAWEEILRHRQEEAEFLLEEDRKEYEEEQRKLRREKEAADAEAERKRLEQEAEDKRKELEQEAADAEAERKRLEQEALNITEHMMDRVAKDTHAQLESLYDAPATMGYDEPDRKYALGLIDALTDAKLAELTQRLMQENPEFAPGYLRCALQTLHVRHPDANWRQLLRTLGLPAVDDAVNLRSAWLPVVEYARWSLAPAFGGVGNRNWRQVEEARLTYDLSAEQWPLLERVVNGVNATNDKRAVFALFEAVNDIHVLEALLEHYDINFEGGMKEVQAKAALLQEKLERYYELEQEERAEEMDAILDWVDSLGNTDATLLHVFYRVPLDLSERKIQNSLGKALEEALESSESVDEFKSRAGPMRRLAQGDFAYVRGKRIAFFKLRNNLVSYYRILLCAEYYLDPAFMRRAGGFPLDCYDRLMARFADETIVLVAQRQVEAIRTAERKVYIIGERAELATRAGLLIAAQDELTAAKAAYVAENGALREMCHWPQVYAYLMMIYRIDFPEPSLKENGDTDEPWSWTKAQVDRANAVGALKEVLESGDFWYYELIRE